MFGSIKLGRLFGIQISVSVVFLPLLAMLLVATWGQGLASVFLLASVLGSVLLHELGHALAAQRYGLVVREVKFWLLGGVAQMSSIPEHPRIEGVIALAGPTVNLLLAALAAPILLLGGALSSTVHDLALIFVVVNLALGIFNLLPAFPMDGGRLLRAALATRLDWLGATEVAVRVGRWVALALAIAGILWWDAGLFLLPVIAVYVWWQGSMELAAVRMRHGAHPLAGFARMFGEGGPFVAGGNGFPFGGAFGAEPAARAATAASEPAREHRDDDDGDWGGARRPSALGIERVPRGGLTDAEIDALERYPGRLRPRRDDA